MTDAELLAIQRQTDQVFTPEGRIERTNDPDRSPGARFSLRGCAEGNLAAVGWEVSDAVAARLLALAAEEPPFVVQSGGPTHHSRYVALVSQDGLAPEARLGVTYVLPNPCGYDAKARLIHSHTQEGEDLLAGLAANGLPPAMLDLGFRDNVSEFWPPWCVALVDGQIASIAFAARLSASGADVGVATVRSHRGRGYAAAATAGWTRSPMLEGRALFYSAAQANGSSRAVVARLGLRFLGASLEMS
ncbi:MAG TPA: hypothetical protein VII73_09335 [Caulobacteraceae bacterium]